MHAFGPGRLASVMRIASSGVITVHQTTCRQAAREQHRHRASRCARTSIIRAADGKATERNRHLLDELEWPRVATRGATLRHGGPSCRSG